MKKFYNLVAWTVLDVHLLINFPPFLPYHLLYILGFILLTALESGVHLN